MKRIVYIIFLLFITSVSTYGQTSLDTLSLKSIFYEPFLAGNRPRFVSFFPDMTGIYYQTNDSSMIEDETFRVNLKGQQQKPLSGKTEQNFVVAPDNKRLVYVDKGDIWLADINFSNKRKLTSTSKMEYNPVWSPDSKRLAFVQQGDVWVLNLSETSLTQITNKEDEDPGYSIIDWAGADKLVLSQSDMSDYKEYYFPEYVHKYVEKGTSKRGVTRQIISIAYLDSSNVKIMFEGKEYVNTSVSASGHYLALDRTDEPMKHRTVTVFDLLKPKSTVVFKDSTKGWIYGRNMSFAPKGDLLMVQSEKDGWNHIYTVQPDGSGLKQHTHGSFDIPWSKWTDKNHLAFVSNEVDPGEYHIYTLDLLNDQVTKLSVKTGYRQHFELSRDKRHIVYQYSYFNEPFELYTIDLKKPGKEVRLTHTNPARFYRINWQKEDYFRFTGRDGETNLSMSVLQPLHKKKNKKYPVVVFVHGAGSLQNVYKGWSDYYYREYMFHQFLNAHGYYVIEVDYRHSTGYGRKFREDVTGWMGKYETQDIEDGINYLAGHYPQADTSHVGIYGGSYGGFMALYATSVAPEYFDAAAALRAVTNWKNYFYTNPWYTWPRLGTPEADSANYARSSPITYADQLQRPILILHGLMDDNVGFQDAAQYVDKLIQTGDKNFQMMIYPTERHSFRDPDAWYDEYSRIFRFFNKYLK